MILDGLKSGEFLREDLEPDISTLEILINDYHAKRDDMDCAHPCNGVCRECRKPVVWVTMVPSMESIALHPELEHGGNIEVRRNGIGKLYGKDTGPDAEERKMILHSDVCKGSWRNERSKMIQDTIRRMR